MRLLFFFLMTFIFLPFANAGEVQTNAVRIAQAPAWVNERRVDKIVDQIQKLLEWDIRRVNVLWYTDQEAFQKIHGYGPTVLAFARKSDNTVHVGPHVTDANFDSVFGHELVHVISFQKFHDAIPKWLEEGLANYLSGRGEVDYKWVASQSAPADIHELVHPFSGTEEHAKYHYMASRALVEMIAAKCNLSDLLQLSVGKKLESYLSTLCGIKDINSEFKNWINGRRD